ncbi:MAG TPA: ATP-binding cassette domain-containing protein [Bryobacteraceae bacterium]|jgi:phospholipid/cholesterol/gamma-HCH transport system ATP-binding protein|nr:ATP-binding cassette domain-containing protein [Bryobacteraceae bacterium]
MHDAVPGKPIISARQLRVQYGEREILHGLDFDINHGEVVVILGGSGSGKSTLLRTIVGLEKPRSGEILVKGTDLGKASKRDIAEVRKKMGLAFQGGALLGSLTVGENIALPLLEHSSLAQSTVDVMVRIKLEQVGLTGFEYFNPSQLSGGMKKRAAFARALALDPEMLFFDEPSAGLDPVMAAGIDDLILSLKRAYSITMVIVTHELASAFLVADRIMVVDKGHIIADEPPETLKQSTHPRVRQFLDRVPDSTNEDDVDHLRLYMEGVN